MNNLYVSYCEIRILAEITAFLRFRYELLDKFLILDNLKKIERFVKTNVERFKPLSLAFLPSVDYSELFHQISKIHICQLYCFVSVLQMVNLVCNVDDILICCSF